MAKILKDLRPVYVVGIAGIAINRSARRPTSC